MKYLKFKPDPDCFASSLNTQLPEYISYKPDPYSHGSNRGYSKVANSALEQHFSGNVVPGTICGDSTQSKSTSTTKTRRTAPLVVETNTSDREGVREVFLS